MDEILKAKAEELGGLLPAHGDEFEPMPLAELIEFEAMLGVTLPFDYRCFLLKYGAVTFRSLVELVPIRPLPLPISSDGNGLFSHFYGVSSEEHDAMSLKWHVVIFRDRMPRTVIPIGSDGGGDQICLGINGNEQEKVFYWDHNKEWDEEDYIDENDAPMPPELRFQNLYLIAESFLDFIERLHASNKG